MTTKTETTETTEVSIDLVGAWETWRVWNVPAGLSPDELDAHIRGLVTDGTFWENAHLADSGSNDYTINSVSYI